MPSPKTIVFLKYYLPFILWTAFILVASLAPSSSIPKVNLINADKLVHLFIYCIFSFLLYRIWLLKSLKQLGIKVFCAAFLFGVFIEFAQQTFTTTRHFDYYDIIANGVGALFFLAVSRLWGNSIFDFFA